MTTSHRSRGRGGKNGHEPRLRITQREQQVVDLLVAGHTQHEIARRVGISQPAVSRILHRVDERWLQDNATRVGEHRAQQIRKLEHLYREAMQSWERSKAQRTRKRQRKTNAPDGAERTAVAEVIVEDSHGDPRYLETARKAAADLGKVWGTTRPSTAETSRDEEDVPAVFTLKIGDERTAPQFHKSATSAGEPPQNNEP